MCREREIQVLNLENKSKNEQKKKLFRKKFDIFSFSLLGFETSLVKLFEKVSKIVYSNI